MYKKKQEKLNFDFLLSPMLFSFLKEKASDSTDNQTLKAACRILDFAN